MTNRSAGELELVEPRIATAWLLVGALLFVALRFDDAAIVDRTLWLAAVASVYVRLHET